MKTLDKAGSRSSSIERAAGEPSTLEVYGMRQQNEKYRAALLVGVSSTINSGMSDKDRAHINQIINTPSPSKPTRTGPYEHVKSRVFDAPVSHN